MRTAGVGFSATKLNNNFFGTRRDEGAGIGSSFVSRKKNSQTKSDKASLVRDLDKRQDTVSVHNFEGSDLSAEEIHRRQVNAKRQQNTFKSTINDKADGFLKLSASKTKFDDSKIKKQLDYSYRDISSMIRQAKTSGHASQAAVKAKRKVMELKRKMASSTDDDEKAEISAALNHAKAMERAAKKKKRHLEVEEMVEHTMSMDKRMGDMKDEGGSSGSAERASAVEEMVSQAETVVEDAYDKIEDMMSDAMEGEGFSESAEYDMASEIPADSEMIPEDDALSDITSEVVSDLGDMYEDFEDAFDMLDEVMEDLELLEVVDPHMDEEGLKKLRTKHRNSEEKDMVKADMDYLKAVFEKYQQDMEKAGGGMAAGNVAAGVAAFGGFGMSFAAPEAGVPSGAVIDVGV